MYVLLQGRKATTKWIKVPSCVDLKGNEETDEMADKGIEKHSLRLKGDVQSRKTAENTSTPQGTPEAKESKRHKTKRTESAPERPSAAYVFCNVFQCQAADGG